VASPYNTSRPNVAASYTSCYWRQSTKPVDVDPIGRQVGGTAPVVTPRAGRPRAAQPYYSGPKGDAITERRDGVQLRKYFAEEEFHLPSVVYEFSSDRGSDARVQVVETLPADLEPEHVGFHTRLGQEDWELAADHLECETTVEDRLAEIESELDDVSQFTDALEEAIRR